MAISCEPEDLVSAAKCFTCLGKLNEAVSIYLLCAWANGGADPVDQGFLLEDEGGYILLSDGGRIIIQT